MRFKYYISPSESGSSWEVFSDEDEVMGIYATQAEAHAAIIEFVAHDVDEARIYAADDQAEMRRNHRGDD